MDRRFQCASASNCLLALGAVLFSGVPFGALAQNTRGQQAHHATADESAVQTALQAYEQGKVEVAEPLLRPLVVRYPKRYAIAEALGSLYAEQGRVAEALPLLERAASLAPREALAHANLGAVYLKLARKTEAVRELERATSLEPRNGQTLANLGQALMLAGQPGAAGKAFSRAADALPEERELRYNAALAYLESGAPQQGALELRKIPAAAMSDQMHALAGEIDERAGNYQQAATEYQAAAQMNPSDENLYALTAELLRHWTWPEAIRVAEFGASRYPASQHFRVATGVARYANNDYKGAIPIFAALLKAEPENATFADLLGRSCSLITDDGSADEDANAACVGMHEFALRHPGNAITSTYAAIALMHQRKEKQDFVEVERLLQAAIAADPKYAEAYLQLGVLDQARLQWKESADALEQSIALRPKSSQAHYRLSRAYAHLGKREEAQAQMSLQQQLSQAEKDGLNARLQEVVTFVLKPS